ncbi:hypothetical protein [Methylobacter svalbardensis]|uniref:hypothetical protein n=1 Tax=Methylobacter svalbardensis TaxID=3080016 RepID=UPI0030EF39EA
MQTYLPFIKALLSEWYLLTLNNPLYAAALASAVWLLTALLYSIRIASVKRAKVASEKAGIEKLNAAQQQLQHNQEELAEAVMHREKAQSAAQGETQRALTLEQLLYQRNQQIAGIIQTLATSFDLGERPLLASEDVKADSLWQQHDKVITQLTERLRTEQQAKIELQQACQAEATKLVEKDVLIKALQTTLDSHTSQLSRLEVAFEEQKTLLQQQQHNAHQVLSDTLKKYQADTARPVEPEQETIKTVTTSQQPISLEESPVIEESPIAQPKPDSPVIQVSDVSHAAVSWQKEAPTEWVTTEEAAAPMPSAIKPQAAVEEAPSVTADTGQQPVIPAKGSLGKFKNLFGKKQQPIKTEPQWADLKSNEPLSSDEKQQPEKEVKKESGKLKGFYSKFRSKGK